MSFVANDNKYVIAWSDKGLDAVINLSIAEKERFIMILMDDPAANFISNPIRDLIVHYTISKKIGHEIWEVISELTEEEIVEEFTKSPCEIKNEIRANGELIFIT